jgi:acetylornithine deacetylase/succinyl-diaminopimelate desuccinylase-like protein
MQGMDLVGLRTAVHAAISEAQPGHLARLREFIAQPSISKEDLGVQACAEQLLGYFQKIGCQEAYIVETPGMPAIWAKYDAGAPKTLAIYGYFDTNVLGPGWTVPPHEAVLGSYGDFDQVLFGRGASNKGGLVAFLNALESIKSTGAELPVNLLFVVEGEEFLGSQNIPWLIERFRSELSQAHALLSPKPSQSASGDISLYLGNKGCLHMELACTGDNWGKGPIGGAVHSSLQCVLDSPVWRLVQALSSLYDASTNRVLVENFYDGLLTSTDEEEALLSLLAERYRGQETAALPGIANPNRIARFTDDLAGVDLFRQYCFEPTMNINGIRAGYTGPGTLLWTLPTAAYATVDIRLPAALDPHDIQAKIRRHLDERGYTDITIEPLEASMGDNPLRIQDDAFQAAMRVFQLWNLEPVIWPRRGAGGPTGFFSRMLDLKILNSTGIGYASGHSDANEYLVIQGNERVGGLMQLEQSLADLLFSFAHYPDPFV